MKDDKQINLQTPYEIKVTHLHQKALEYQDYRYRQGQPPALASPRRTARHERIPPNGFDMAALRTKNCPPAMIRNANCCSWASLLLQLSAGRCGHRSLLFLFCLPDSLIGNTVQLALAKNKPAPTETPVRAGFAASEQFHLFRYSRFTFSYACSLPRLPLPVQCLPE